MERSGPAVSTVADLSGKQEPGVCRIEAEITAVGGDQSVGLLGDPDQRNRHHGLSHRTVPGTELGDRSVDKDEVGAWFATFRHRAQIADRELPVGGNVIGLHRLRP